MKELKEAIKTVESNWYTVTWDAESAKEYNDALALVLDLAESVLAMDKDKIMEMIRKEATMLKSQRERIADAILSAMKGGGE